jgi:hypothetical protein
MLSVLRMHTEREQGRYCYMLSPQADTIYVGRLRYVTTRLRCTYSQWYVNIVYITTSGDEVRPEAHQ